jgi:uncharacterized membrane protein
MAGSAPSTVVGTGDEDIAVRRSRLRLAALLLGMGTLHFVVPGPFMRIVPPALGRPRFWVYLSGVAEIVSGALLLSPKTSRLGGTAAAATIVAVYPANIQMALDAGLPRTTKALLIWLRLPLQAPLVAWALRHARGR